MPTLKLEASTASKLIELLSSDDNFRELFATDTLAALGKVGQAPNKELEAFVAQCCSKVQLADKSKIAGAKAQIAGMLTSGTNYTIPMLDAGFDDTRTLK